MGSESLVGRYHLVGWWALAVAIQSLLAFLSLAKASSLGYGPHLPIDYDIKFFYSFASPILEGRLPYRDYPVEYPVLAIPVFLAPLIAGTSYARYQVAFVVEMLLLNAWTVWLVTRQVAEAEGVERVPARLGWYTLFFGLQCPLIVARYDIVPMALGFVSVFLATRGRSILGGFVAGIGTLAKLVPALVLLPLVIEPGGWKPKGKILASFGVTVLLGFLGWWSLGGERIITSLRFHSERGIEIGSLYASIYLVAHKVAGVMIGWSFDHGSININGPGTRIAASCSTIVLAASLVLVAWRGRRSGPGQEFRFAAAALLAYITFGKVLSPQYLIWLIPFFCVVDGSTGSTARKAYLICCFLTNALYPYLFHPLCFFETQAVAVLALRNLALLGLFAILMGPSAPSSRVSRG